MRNKKVFSSGETNRALRLDVNKRVIEKMINNSVQAAYYYDYDLICQTFKKVQHYEIKDSLFYLWCQLASMVIRKESVPNEKGNRAVRAMEEISFILQELGEVGESNREQAFDDALAQIQYLNYIYENDLSGDIIEYPNSDGMVVFVSSYRYLTFYKDEIYICLVVDHQNKHYRKLTTANYRGDIEKKNFTFPISRLDLYEEASQKHVSNIDIESVFFDDLIKQYLKDGYIEDESLSVDHVRNIGVNGKYVYSEEEVKAALNLEFDEKKILAVTYGDKATGQYYDFNKIKKGFMAAINKEISISTFASWCILQTWCISQTISTIYLDAITEKLYGVVSWMFDGLAFIDEKSNPFSLSEMYAMFKYWNYLIENHKADEVVEITNDNGKVYLACRNEREEDTYNILTIDHVHHTYNEQQITSESFRLDIYYSFPYSLYDGQDDEEEENDNSNLEAKILENLKKKYNDFGYRKLIIE
ncbi:MAG: hypothetical protein WC201_02760 [Bacilli bacterium]